MTPGRIALTGGIATGKSTVAGMFAELGAVILDADKAAREVVEPGAPCWSKLQQLLGPSFFDPSGQLERRKLRDCIIRDDQCRMQVNSILHPAIIAAMEDEWRRRVHSAPHIPVLFDIPLLFETHLANRFDTILLVYTPREIQISRLMERDSLTRLKAEETLAMQLPIESKKALSHIVIDNSKDLEQTRVQVLEVWKRLRSQ